MTTTPFFVVFAIFPEVTQLDFTGPWEVFTRLPGARVVVGSVNGGPVRAQNGLVFAETRPLADIDRCDLICVPGGPGSTAMMTDEAFLKEVRRLSEGARYTTSVCTGALILGAAGLLKGKRATTHWAAREVLARLGAEVVEARVVRDGEVITGGGVTAGIDFGLAVAAEVAGGDVARSIQLALEYAPDPPFDCGDPRTAPAAMVERYRADTIEWTKARMAAAETAARRP